MMKNFAENNIMVAIKNPELEMDVLKLLNTKYKHLAVIVDLDCRGSIELIKDVSYIIV